jgi:hypothetical protein
VILGVSGAGLVIEDGSDGGLDHLGALGIEQTVRVQHPEERR